MEHKVQRHRFCPYDGKALSVDPSKEGGRPCCRKCKYVDYHNPAPCVAILIVKEEKVLLARRAFDPSKGMWDIPGGFVDAGESAEKTVEREALEETGLSVRVVGFLGSLPDTYGEREDPTLTLCFLADVLGGDMKAASDVDELAWFSLSNVPPQMAFSHQAQVLQWCRDRRSGL